MFEALIFEWLEEYNSLSESEIRSYASEQIHNNEIVVALYTVFDEHTKYSQLINPVCNQLFCFYRSGEEDLQRFTLQFLPMLVLLYLENVTHGDRQLYRSVETLLIGIYNLEIIDKSGQAKVFSFRIPSIAQASIYHEPTTLEPAFLTASCLRRWEECNSKLVNWGPLPQVEYLNAQNRLRVMTALLFIYNRQLGKFSGTSLEYLCKTSSRLVTQGFHTSGSHVRLSCDSDNSYSTQLIPRVALSSQLLLEILNAIYYALFDRNTTHATQALDDIYNRACYESYIDVLLVANSIKNLLHISRSGISDGIMNMNVNLQQTPSSSVSVIKSMITNASFRTKKLPDDIPIQLDKDDDTGLGAISEEKEEEEKASFRSSIKASKETATSSALAGVKNLPKTISGLGKKVKESKVGLKSSTQSLEKEKSESTKRNADMEKDMKYFKEENLNSKPPAEEMEYKNLIVVDKEKVSLVSDSIKTHNDVLDSVASSGTPKIDSYNEIISHNAVHVSSV